MFNPKNLKALPPITAPAPAVITLQPSRAREQIPIPQSKGFFANGEVRICGPYKFVRCSNNIKLGVGLGFSANCGALGLIVGSAGGVAAGYTGAIGIASIAQAAALGCSTAGIATTAVSAYYQAKHDRPIAPDNTDL